MTPDLRRHALPPTAVLVIALIVSYGLHVPVYVGLGALKVLLERPALDVPSAMEVEFVSPDEAPEESAEVDERLPDEAPRALDDEEEEEERRARVQDTPEAVEEPPPLPSLTQPRAQRQEMSERATSVEHRSRDPNVDPPPEAQHLAEENSRVEEETLARIRNLHRNDENPEPAAPEEPPPDSAEEGDSADETMAELQDQEGSDERDPTTEETRLPPDETPRTPSRSRTPAVAEAARGDRRGGAARGAESPREVAGGGRRTQGGGEVQMREVIVSDGTGSYVVRVPVRPEGTGDGEGGGEAVVGLGRGLRGEGRADGREGRGRRRARGGSARGRGAPNLRVSWTSFTSLYGEEELERERQLRLEQRRSTSRGASRAERWRRFRAAIESYDVRVRPGNQTALNTRADPFASYIAAMHRRIHPRFAQGFLSRMPSTVAEAFRANPNMHTRLELGVDAQGSVHHVTVVATSGDTLFDLGAFEAVMGAQPFPVPPDAIQSPDGLVYLQWGFFRNHRQCGTFNARPYILADAPRPREREESSDTEAESEEGSE